MNGEQDPPKPLDVMTLVELQIVPSIPTAQAIVKWNQSGGHGW